MKNSLHLSFWLRTICLVLLILSWNACDPDKRDPNVHQDGREHQDNREIISTLILRAPIYECGRSVWVQGFIPGAEITVFADGAPIGSMFSDRTWGDKIEVSISFTGGQVITARQRFDGVTSGPSNAVTVTNYREDFPDGIPKPIISPTPLYDCGQAIGYRDVIPNAWIKVFAENPIAGGGFDPPVEIGNALDFPYCIVSPFRIGQRITIQSGLCTDVSLLSDPFIVVAEPATIPETHVDPVYDQVTIVVVWGTGGSPNLPLNGASLDVFSPSGNRIGGQPTPGGGGQQVGITPAVASNPLTSRQTLCTEGPESPPITVLPCDDLPPAKIRTPAPGDVQVEVIEYVPGARIIITAGGSEVGDGGPPLVNLTRPLVNGEEVIVYQQIGTCRSRWTYHINVACPYADPVTCEGDWPMFRQNRFRDAQQVKTSSLSDPAKVKTLAVRWDFAPTPAGDRGFRSSPIVYRNKVYIGSSNGHLYCLDANNGHQLWQYPPAGSAALTSQYLSNPSSYGLASSATIARIRNERDVVIFGAPDQSIGARLGSGRLFALDVNTGTEVWKSDEIAVLNGLNRGSTSERHEQIGYSSPLVYGDRVYIGIANHGDNPIQNGRVVAVELSSGAIIGTFNYQSTNDRGGGVWTTPAGGFDGVYVTTGNSNIGGSEPSPNHGLSMLKLDPNTGAILWKLQPVPYALDGDPDWASGAALINSSCGPMSVSTMKDGWSYAVATGGTSPVAPAVFWQFPPTGIPFTTGDGTTHGDSRYLVPGAGWKDVFITMTGGKNVTTDLNGGFGRIHALNVCQSNAGRVRWLADIPSTPTSGAYRMGPPSVSGGIVYVGTSLGNLVVLADPSVWPPQFSRCDNPSVSVANCVSMGNQLVYQPTILTNINLPGIGRILCEPALANGRVFVAGDGGRVYMLEPERK